MDSLISEWEKRRYVPKPGEPDLPPQLSDMAGKTTDDVIQELNRLPFFMTELDETDGDGGENQELEALRSLAYDGEPHDIATNFKTQGNDCYKTKNYKDAVRYYNQALEVECGVDEITISLYLNRAACNLELKNYRSCIEDCKKVFMLDEKNVKACYRSGKAFFHIEKYEEAKTVLNYGLSIDSENKSIKDTLKLVEQKESRIQEDKIKREKERKLKEMRQEILTNAIKLRHFSMMKTKGPPELFQDVGIKLENETDYESQLLFPAMIIYPTIDEFDFVAQISELNTPNEILNMILDRPEEWLNDPKHAGFKAKNLECFMETESGGLVKVGKKVSVNQAMISESPKAPLFDNGLLLYVVPKEQTKVWIATWNKSFALSKRLST